MVPTLKMDGKEKQSVKKVSFNWFSKFCSESDNSIVAGSQFHDAGPATANARSPKLYVVVTVVAAIINNIIITTFRPRT